MTDYGESAYYMCQELQDIISSLRFEIRDLRDSINELELRIVDLEEFNNA